MARLTPDQLLRQISKDGGKFLPCPRRKDRASIAVEVCQTTCRHARRCPIFLAWLRPPLALDFG